jgi:hypothetical protein
MFHQNVPGQNHPVTSQILGCCGDHGAVPSDNRAHEGGKGQDFHFHGVRCIVEEGQNLPPTPPALWALAETSTCCAPRHKEKRENPRQVDPLGPLAAAGFYIFGGGREVCPGEGPITVRASILAPPRPHASSGSMRHG